MVSKLRTHVRHNAGATMRRLAAMLSILGTTLATATAAAVAAPPQTFVTGLRVDCGPGTTGASAVTLTRDEVPLSTTPLECSSGGNDRVDVVTTEKPNDWHIPGGFAGFFLCVPQSGTVFPELYTCGGHLLTVFISKPHPGS
jgi:hypothetical protein